MRKASKDAINFLQTIISQINEIKPRIETMAVKELEARMKRRIFNDGTATDGSLIHGGYSSQPGYYVREDFFRKSKFKPGGKNSTSPFFKNGKKRQSMYLPGGYAQLRELHGLQTNKVDLMFSGSLMTSITTGNFRGKTVLGFIDFNEINKARGAEFKYGKRIFEPSAEEINAVEKLVLTELNKISL